MDNKYKGEKGDRFNLRYEGSTYHQEVMVTVYSFAIVRVNYCSSGTVVMELSNEHVLSSSEIQQALVRPASGLQFEHSVYAL